MTGSPNPVNDDYKAKTGWVYHKYIIL
jgi:hypothetical protein